MLKINLLRHGESELSHLFRGFTDDKLTQNGWQQMQAGFDNAILNGKTFDAVITSDLQRCRLFAEHIATMHNLPLLVLDGLREMNFGDWEGQSAKDLFDNQADILAKFWQTPTQYTPPNAESLTDFAKRIDKALDSVKDFAKQNAFANILIITHGGVIKYVYIKATQEHLDKILTMPAELGSLHTFCIDNNQLLLNKN